MITSRADFVLYFGCGPTGIPRPLSLIVTVSEASKCISIRFASPATASSMALSSNSATRCCIAASSEPPIYIPGRLRTGSKPSRTSISLAEYSLFFCFFFVLSKRSFILNFIGYLIWSNVIKI